jgi:hypothetical protein
VIEFPYKIEENEDLLRIPKADGAGFEPRNPCVVSANDDETNPDQLELFRRSN